MTPELPARPHAAGALKVLVLGGGFAGLRIAYLLDRMGYPVTLVEASGQPGGMVSTFARESRGGRFLFDFGPHLFFKEYLDEYRDLLGDDLLPLDGHFTMYALGTTLTYPLRPLEMLGRMGIIRSAGYIADYLAGKLPGSRRPSDPDNLADELSRRFGRKLFRDFYAPYIVKCNGLPVAETDILWARERENVSGRSLASNLWNTLLSKISSVLRARLGATNDPAAERITAWYPRLGSGQLCEAMANRLSHTTVRTHCRVTGVELQDGRCSSVLVEGPGGDSERLTADLVVSTIPLPDLAKALSPVNPAVTQAASMLRYRTVRLVNLIIDQPRALDSLEMFSMDPQHLYKRVYEPKAMSPVMAPEGMTSLCLEVCCTHGDTVSTMPDTSLADACTASLVDLGLIDSPERVTDSFVVPLVHAYPIYHRGIIADRQKVLDAVTAIPNLVTCGRQGVFRYHSMTNEVMETADSIVRFIQSGCVKEGADNRRSPWGQSFY